MNNPRSFTVLLLALSMALAAAPLRAQTAGSEGANSAPPPTTSNAEEHGSPGSTNASTKAADQKGNNASTGKSSPFDYRASEQISEDVPVSFPVDI